MVLPLVISIKKYTLTLVTSDNMHSVTSNAVAQAIGNISNFKIIESSVKSFTFTANLGTAVAITFTVPSGYKSICMSGWDISGASGAISLYATTSQEFYNRSGTFTENVWFRNYTGSQYTVTIKVFLLCLKQA